MGICVYCANECDKLTDEHVIPRMFYLDELRIEAITSICVPVCEPCNRSAQLVQEQVRAWFTLLASDTNKVADWLIKHEVRRSFARRPSLKSIIANKLSLVNLRTPEGLYLGRTAATVKMTERDWRNWEKFLDLVVRGIIYKVHGSILPSDAKVLHVVGFQPNYFTPKPSLVSWLKDNRDSLVCTDGFKEVYYSFSGIVPGSMDGVVFSVFYGKLSFMSFFGEGGLYHGKYEEVFKNNEVRIVS